MTKKRKSKAPKKARKKGKVKRGPPPEPKGMAISFDAAMTRIARAPWPPKKRKQ